MADVQPDAHRHLDDAAALAIALGNGEPEARAHLRTCQQCAAMVGEWSAIRSASVVAVAPQTRPVPAGVLQRALAEIDSPIGATPRWTAGPVGARAARPRLGLAARLRWAGQLLVAQVPILRRTVLASSALLFVIGAMVVLAARSGHAAEVLTSLAPVVAVVGLAMVHGPEVDPAIEIATASGTSPRVVLLARLVLITAFDLGIALAATLLTSLISAGTGITTMVVAWFGPLLLLASVSLAVSVLSRPAIGMGAALGLWILRLSVQPEPVFTLPASLHPLTSSIADALAVVCATNLPTVGIAVVLVACTVLVAPRQLRLSV